MLFFFFKQKTADEVRISDWSSDVCSSDLSINPSLGINGPLNFRPGNLKQREAGINADFVYPLETGLFATPLNIAFGGEWRREQYVIQPGDPASFASGPTAALFGVGSDGFQGDSPESSGQFARNSGAGYLDLETKLTDRKRVV